MRKLVSAWTCAGLLLALAPTAAAGLVVGVNDDAGKYESGSSWFFPTMAANRLAVNAITLRWDETDPTAIAEQALIEAALEKAQAAGVDVVLDLYPMRSKALTAGKRCRPTSDPQGCGDTRRIEQFAAWAASVARAFPSVREFVVMNECNQPMFVNPQWNVAGQNQSAAICGRALVAAYDALKDVRPQIFVWGLGLSPRGNDRPQAVTNSSTSPVRFIGALGAWFRAYASKTRRTAPLMDGFDFHPYPVPQTLSFEKGYAHPTSASVANLTRIYQAVFDAFAGTPQRTIGQHRGGGLPVSLNETGIQTDSSGRTGYTGVEVSASGSGGVSGRFATEAYQADWYLRMLKLVACDPNVRIVNIFHLVDEQPLEGWQSGIYFADRSPKRSADTVVGWIARTGGNCDGRPVGWTPAAALRPPVTVSLAGVGRHEAAKLR